VATTVTMPQLGETVTEGTILRWAKKVGDSIATDEVLVEISTDKVDTEIPSPAAGVVMELLVEEGQTVAVGTALAKIGEPGEGQEPTAAHTSDASSEPTSPAAPESEAPAAAPAPTEPVAPAAQSDRAPAQASGQADSPVPSQPEAAPESAAAPPQAPAADVAQPAASPSPGPVADGQTKEARSEVLSPVVRRLVREHGVDLGEVGGTGEGGRITRRDVEGYLARRPDEAAPASAEPPAARVAEPVADAAPAAPAAAPTSPAPSVPPPPTRPISEAPAPISPPAPVAASGSEEVPLDRLRVRIGENMIRAKQSAAHVWTSVEVDYERVERVRQAHKEAWKKEEGFSLTYLPFIARATIDALKEYPVVNSSFFLEEKKAVFHRSVNLGIAIDLNQKGLIVATIRNADGLRLVGLARKIKELADKARAGKLEPDDVTGSTFSITNPGPFGSFMSAPIINVPNVGLLSTETITKRPAVVTTDEGQDTIAIRHIGYLGFSWDHRAFDGSTAVLFLQRIKHNLENWDWNQELA
jgi:pyruvate dehydrogenase E2 component (dihydrolipoyllysine-residue acetyltransferase)